MKAGLQKVIDYILLETFYLFFFCACFFWNVYPKIKFTAKTGLTYIISIVKCFCFFLSEKRFLTFHYWIYTDNIVKTVHKRINENLQV